MKVIAVDGSPGAALISLFPDGLIRQLTIVCDHPSQDICAIASEIIKNLAPDDLICISTFFAALGESIGQPTGIKLIKYLRLAKVTNPILLYNAILDVTDWIKHYPEHFILSSKGIKVIQTSPVREFTSINDVKIPLAPSEESYWKPYILVEFRIPEYDRHSIANFWSILRLFDIQRAISRINQPEKPFPVDYPSAVDRQLRSLFAQQALFLFGYKEEILNRELLKVQKQWEVQQKKREEWMELRQFFEGKLKRYQQRQNQLLHKAEQVAMFEGFHRDLVDSYVDIIKLLDDKQLLTEESKSIGERQDLFQKQLTLVGQQIDNVEVHISMLEDLIQQHLDAPMQQIAAILSQNGIELSLQIQKLQLKVLHIDDQAHDGWTDVVQYLLYGGSLDQSETEILYSCIVPRVGQSVRHEIYPLVKHEIERLQPQLIFLDLRLAGESGPIVNMQEVSGDQILKLIRTDFPAIPVIITTASNKSVSYEYLFGVGCDGFWTKEGMDTGMTIYDSIANYEKLLKLINNCAQPYYQFSQTFWQGYEIMKNAGEPLWWEVNKHCKREELLHLYRDTWLLLREYLQRELLGSMPFQPMHKWLFPGLIMQNVGKLLEAIHGGKELMLSTGRRLYDMRNLASHHDPSYQLNIDSLTSSLQLLKDYLIKGPGLTEANSSLIDPATVKANVELWEKKHLKKQHKR